jgi:excinuclease ABC subunit C
MSSARSGGLLTAQVEKMSSGEPKSEVEQSPGSSQDSAAELTFDSASLVKSLPGKPGVYRMLGEEGEVLYVGKARDLRKRVASYFQKLGLSPRTSLMVKQIRSVEVTVAQSEGEALILENNLIKSLKPRYNILFRDDKSYPYLMLEGQDFPRLAFFRGSLDRSSRYFGPFPHAGAVRESIQLLQRVFQLRTCEDSVFRNRTRPCLLHQIRRCSAPCVGRISEDSYRDDVVSASLLLEGKSGDLLDRLTIKMQESSEHLQFEMAAIYRDQIQALTKMTQRQAADTGTDIDADIISIASEAGVSCVNLVMVRGGRQLGDRSFFPGNAGGTSDPEVVAAFLSQHYQDRPVPRLVICEGISSSEELEEWLRVLAGKAIQVVARTNGVRKTWAEMSLKNAQHALRARLAEVASQEDRLRSLSELLDLPGEAERIECFDISHIRGEATVASCVVYAGRRMSNSDYRRFNIEGIAPGDDYGAMRQAISRRYAKTAEGQGSVPDLILIDGGRGQLGVARDVLADLGLGDIAVAAVSKGPSRKPGEEQIWTGDGLEVALLPVHRPALHLIQEVRDEAHRFAITGHRSRRDKKRVTSSLEQISGIGAKRRRDLLARFGGLRGVQGASIDDIAQVKGISRALAERIYRELHAD